MHNTTQRTLLALTLTAAMATASAAQALPLVALDFSTSDQWANNFINVRNGTIYWSGNHDGYVFANTSSSNPNVRYDTDPGDNNTRDIFLRETVSAEFWHSFPPNNNPFLSLYARVQPNHSGILATVQFVTSTSIQFRLSYGANMLNGSLGTYFYQATFTLSTPPSVTPVVGTGGTAYSNTAPVSSMSTGATWTTIHRMNLALEQTGDDVFTLTLSDAQGLIATTGPQVLAPRTDLGHTEANVAAYRDAGSVGFRMSAGSNDVKWGFDTFSLVSPPPTATLILLK